MAAAAEPLASSQEDRANGDIAFVHWGHAQGHKEGYTQLDQGPAHNAQRELVLEMFVEAPSGPPKPDAAPAAGAGGGFLSKLWQKGLSELRIGLTRAVESWTTFVEEVAQLRATLWGATGSLVQWGAPCAAVALSVLVQAFSARVTTLYYIRYMLRLERIVNRKGSSAMPADPLGSNWILTEHLDYPQKLQDIFASFVEDPVEVPTFVWDLTLFPLTLACLCLIICCRDVYMWAKVCSCFVALNLGRAACHVSTVVPDSQGWEACKARLTNFGTSPEALEHMGAMQINWRSGAFDSLVQIVQAEAKGMRYCGDMVYSGQTFVMLLFALGLCEVLHRNWPEHRRTLWLVGCLVFPFVIVCSLGALAARYHYTLDVLLAALLTALWFDSSTLASACAWWASLVQKGVKERQVFVPDRLSAPKLSTFALVQGSAMYVLEMVMICMVTWDFHKTGYDAVAAVYLGALLFMSLVLVIFSFHLFSVDEDLRSLPLCVRFPLAVFLGSTHLIYLLTQGLSYKRKKLIDESFVIKVFKASLQSAPLACMQLHTLLVFQELRPGATPWKRYLQMVSSFYSLGEAVALFDAMRSSVLEEIVRNALWRTLVAALRMAEVASRISSLVIFQCIAERNGYRWQGAPALIALDFVISAALVRYFRVARNCMAVFLFAVISLTSNVYLFQRDPDRRRLADILCTFRIAEFVIFGAVAVWYFKFYPGGMAACISFIATDEGAFILLVVSLTMYFIMLVVWLEIRRSQLPREWDDKASRPEED